MRVWKLGNGLILEVRLSEARKCPILELYEFQEKITVGNVGSQQPLNVQLLDLRNSPAHESRIQ